MMSDLFFPKLNSSIQEHRKLSILPERQAHLDNLIQTLGEIWPEQNRLQLSFICTHNSRRSQLAQAWGHTAAQYFNLNIQCFSAGTEATAFHPNAVAVLRETGFRVHQEDNSLNPQYYLQSGPDDAGLKLFSKAIGHANNPTEDFIAIMTCAEAEENCPYVPGAQKRMSLPYSDPRTSDDSRQAQDAYRQCSAQIAAELFYIFEKIRHEH